MQARDRLSWLGLDHIILPETVAVVGSVLDIPVTGFEWWVLLSLRWTLFNNSGFFTVPIIQFLNGSQIIGQQNPGAGFANGSSAVCNFSLFHPMTGGQASGFSTGSGLFIGVGDQTIRLTCSVTDPGSTYAVSGGTLVGRLWQRKETF